MFDIENKDSKLIGFFRGIVLQHCSNGRCKIFFPDLTQYKKTEEPTVLNLESLLKILNPEILPFAEPAAPIFCGCSKGNGCFSYPDLGSIVWCFFQNGDANYPVYFASSLGGERAANKWLEVRPNVTDETIKNGTDAYISELIYNKTKIKIFNSGRIEIITLNKDEKNSSRVSLDGNGNIYLEASRQLELTAPVIMLKADEKITVESKSYVNNMSSDTTLKSKSIQIYADKIQLTGKRHNKLIN